MPLNLNPGYKPPFPLFNGHLQTIIPFLYRRVNQISFKPETISTPDGDFLDLAWLVRDRSHLVILSHGFEGDACRTYMRGMAQWFDSAGFDVLAWNFRGCSGRLNNLPLFYHSGQTEDLTRVLQHALQARNYDTVILIGFSLGGNLTLKYLGEQGNSLPEQVKGAITISVPVDLVSSARKIDSRENFIYSRRFLKTLKAKIRAKARIFPEELPTGPLVKINSIWAFDDIYTAPMFGFKDAHDYYSQCRSLNFLESIRVPTLLLNARNDPFLTPPCFPEKIAKDHAFLYLEAPLSGGHVGFMTTKNFVGGPYWHETRALEFVMKHLS